jgi:long-chain acyl-CoA synthetase
VPSLAALSGVDPEAIAVTDGTTTLTWADLEDRSARIGHGLGALGAIPGSHVAICVSNRSEFVEAVLGAWRAGCAYTPLKTGWTESEVGAVLDDAGTTVVIADRDGGRRAANRRGVAVIDLDSNYESWLSKQDATELPEDRCGYKLPYTSGTTGRPKGVMMRGSGTTPFAAGWAGIAKWAQLLHLPGEGTHLFLSRLFNGAPQTFGFGAMARGATLRILPRWDAAAALAALSAPDVTSTIAVPTMFRQWIALADVDRSSTPAPSLRTMLHGGEPCALPVKEAMADWFGDVLVEYYGFTEGGITVLGADEWRDHPGSVGKPIANLTVRILDDTGADVAPNTEGTVYFHPTGDTRYFNYQGDDSKTDSAHRGESFTVGDVGYLDDDGYLYLCGRVADVVITAGVNVYPAEIDQALCNVPGIADLCAVGIADAELGEVIKLYAALLPGADEAETRSQIEATATDRLAPYKRPRSVEFIDEIPRDQTGKLLRRMLRDKS